MEIEFEDKGHIYSINGEIASISVTELLKKHGLAPNYDGANKQLVKKSADIGKKVHKDLENILNEPKYEPTTEQGKHFAEWVKANLDCGVGEQILGYENNGFLLAGTADVMAIGKNKALILGDHKNTSAFHREYVSWQVSILDYMARQLGNEKVNGKLLNWKGASEFYCFHYDPKTADMEVIELEKIPDCEIERLLTAEQNNEIYQRPVLMVDKELQEQVEKAEEYLTAVQNTFETAKENVNKLREQMLKLFEEQKIKTWESPNKKVQITYVEPIERTSVDSKKLKENYPKVFTDCQKLTKVKSSLRVKVRGSEDEE